MRISALLYLYRRRLRSHGPQELLAAVGIAIAVALVFAAIESERSIGGSAAQIVGKVVGPANLQIRGRGGESIDESLLARVKRQPGVRQAAPLLEETATLRRGSRTVRVQIAGTDLRLAVLDGLAETLPIGTLSAKGVAISRATAGALALPGGHVKRDQLALEMRGASTPMHLTAVLGDEAVGPLSGALVAVMPLKHMQRLSGLQGQVSRILVEAKGSAVAKVRSELRALVGGRLEVAPAREDVALLRQALAPSGLASGLFAAIGALLGFLLAFNAMLLTVADRRRTIAELRVSGAKRATIVEMVLFEAICLAMPASIAGLLAGYALCTSVFHQSTAYLAEAFTLSGTTLLQPLTIVLTLLGGALATCAASAVPLLDLRRGRARDAAYRGDAAPGFAMSAATRNRLAATAVGFVAVASILFALLPSAAIAATALLAFATVLAVPLAFAGVLKAASALGERAQRVAILPLALSSLRATTVRSLALAATGAVALFGSVALGGSREDLLRGIDSFASSYVAAAPIWVGDPGDNQAVDGFDAAGVRERIERVHGVASVEAFQGGFVRLGDRRSWVIARPPSADARLLAAEVREASAARARQRLSEGGWIVLSQQIATERDLHVGDALTLQTPTGPARFRVAATSTNLAWPPGVIVMSRSDWAHDFATSQPTALGVRLTPGANPGSVRAAVAAALGTGSGLEVSLAGTRARSIDALASTGLGQLREVSTMLLIAAIVAMVAAIGSSFWQRREGLAGLRLFGARPASLQGILLLEASLMLLAGCVTGAIAGIYGQVVIDAFLRHVTGFPLASPTTSWRPLEVLLLVLAAALVLGTPSSWVAARVPPALAIANE